MSERKILTGDAVVAAGYIGLARRHLAYTKLLGVPKKTTTLDNGVRIIVSHVAGGDKLWVDAPPRGTLLVADSSNFRWKQVYKKPLGGRPRVFGSEGTGEGQFSGAAFGIAPLGDKIYVTNTALKAVDTYSLTGEFLIRTIVSNFPVTHISAADGQIAVVTVVGGSAPSNDTVLVFDTDFNLVTSFPQIAQLLIGAVHLHGGKLYVGIGSGGFSPDIQVFDIASGTPLFAYNGMSLCEGLTSFDDELYAVDPNGPLNSDGAVKVFPLNETGPVTRFFGTRGPVAGEAGLGEFEALGGGPRGIAVDSTGVYVSDVNSGVPAESFRFRDSLNKFMHSGTALAKHVGFGTEDNQYNQPFGLAITE